MLARIFPKSTGVLGAQTDSGLLNEQNGASCWSRLQKKGAKAKERTALAQLYMDARSLWNRRPRPPRKNVVKRKRTRIFHHKKNGSQLACSKRTSRLSEKFAHQTNSSVVFLAEVHADTRLYQDPFGLNTLHRSHRSRSEGLSENAFGR